MAKKEEKKHTGGRPPIWTDPVELKQLVFDYFNEGRGKDRPTLAGLARALGIDRQTLYNYAKKDEFFDIIRGARQRVEEIYEDRLVFEQNSYGVKFALQNMGWADKTQVDHTSKGEKITGFNYIVPKEEDEADNQTNEETASSVPEAKG